jgi:hypothetical protein
MTRVSDSESCGQGCFSEQNSWAYRASANLCGCRLPNAMELPQICLDQEDCASEAMLDEALNKH